MIPPYRAYRYTMGVKLYGSGYFQGASREELTLVDSTWIVHPIAPREEINTAMETDDNWWALLNRLLQYSKKCF